MQGLTPPVSKRISLVLGSGAARGYAHIGVIEELRTRGYEIVSVSGSSIGVFVGGLYVYGELENFKRWILELDILIEIPHEVHGFYEFHRAYEMIALGRRIARDTLEELQPEVI